MSDGLTAPFTMHGARDAISEGLDYIEEQVNGIEQAVIENPGLVFDLARTLIETACRTILRERGIAFDQADEVPKLFKTVAANLPFLPPEESGAVKVRRSLARTLSGLSTAVQGVCELRNQCGFASHGGDSRRPAMEAVQALLAAGTADAIVGFLHRVHKRAQDPPPKQPLRYEDNEAFNTYIDEAHSRVEIFDEGFEPSRVLFAMAPEPYRIYLAEFLTSAETDEDSAQDDGLEAPR